MSGWNQARLFLSAATNEFASHRRLLANAFRPLLNVEVKVQEDFDAAGGTTLAQLDDYIRGCDAVVHLCGASTGTSVPQLAVAELQRRHDLTRFPELARLLEDAATAFSYTQWEAYLALLHDKPLYVFGPDERAPPSSTGLVDDAERRLQLAHRERLRTLDRHVHEFSDHDGLIQAVFAAVRARLPPLPEVKGRRAFLTVEDFTVITSDSRLIVGMHPSLQLLRHRQYMLRPAYVNAICERLAVLMAQRREETFCDLDVLWISGASGSGKSVLLLQVMEQVVRDGSRAIWLKDDVGALVELLEALAQDGADDRAAPELVFIDDLYAPRNKEALNLDVIRRAVASNPDRPWPLIVTCGPTVFMDLFKRDAAGNGLRVQPWQLPLVRQSEERQLRAWFASRRVTAPGPMGATQSGGLMLSLAVELLHGDINGFARRFRERLEAATLTKCLSVPLALNRLYIRAPASWLDEAEWERLAAFNGDADFAILATAEGERYVQLTHPHLSDAIYRQVREPGGGLAYANDLAEAVKRAVVTDHATLLELGDVLAEGNERLAEIDEAALRDNLAKSDHLPSWDALKGAPEVYASICCALALWSARRPDLELDVRFGANLLEAARAALVEVSDNWPKHWLRLRRGYPHDRALVALAVERLGVPRALRSPQARRAWSDILGAGEEFQQEADLVVGRALNWLSQYPEDEGWGSAMTTVLGLPSLEASAEQVQSLVLNWLSEHPRRNQWGTLWLKLLARSETPPDELLQLAHERLKRGLLQDWTRIWLKLSELDRYPTGYGRDSLLIIGARLCQRTARSTNWSYVWERLLSDPNFALRVNARPLVDQALSVIRSDLDRGDWTHIWERLLELAVDSPAELLRLGFDWLEGHEERKDWGVVWNRVLRDHEIAGLETDQVLAVGLRWLVNREELAQWTWVWDTLINSSTLPREDDLSCLLESGQQWLAGHQDHPSHPIVCAQLLCRTADAAAFDDAAHWLLKHLHFAPHLDTVQKSRRLLLRRFTRKRASTDANELGREERELAPLVPGPLRAWFEGESAKLDELRRGRVRQDIVRGTITSLNKRGTGCYIMLQNGCSAYAWTSDLSAEVARDLKGMLGEDLEFQVMGFYENNLTARLSQLALSRRELFAELQPGQQLRGRVKSLLPYGAFVTVDETHSLDGLVALIDLAWGRVQHPAEVVSVGDLVNVQVLKNGGERYLSLGIKQTQPDPWLTAAERYQVGMRVVGKVVNVVNYGAFLELEPGVDGLLHDSELPQGVRRSRKLGLGNYRYRISDAVECSILEVDANARRIRLGAKQLGVDPWHEFVGNFKVGDRVIGAITSITDYGVFITLAEGLDGMIHKSDLSWTAEVDRPRRFFRKGEVLEAQILLLEETPKRRVGLGLKQLKPEPRLAEDRFRAGDFVDDALVIAAGEGGALISLGDCEAMLLPSVTTTLPLARGERVRVQIASVDPVMQRLFVSLA